jgi:predicted nucleic acid-binding protein
MARGKKHRESQQQPVSQSGSPGPSGADSSNPQQKPQLRQAKPGYDKFILEKTFPDINAMLQPQPFVADFADEALFVLDTNILLDPFEVGTKTLDEITAIFQRLWQADRLYVPARVLREFARHRTEKMRDIYVKVAEKFEKVPSPELGLRTLKTFAGYERADSALKAARKALDEYRNSLAGLKDEIALWNWNDEITKRYVDLFVEGNAIIEPGCNEQQLEDDLKNRVAHNLPPGFGDAGKDDGGIGDIIIWQCILKLGKDTGKSVVFVTQEKNKSDWVVKGRDAALYPCFELVYEFRSKTGQNFAIMDFERFMAFHKASPSAIEEVKEVSTAYESKAVLPAWSPLDPVGRNELLGQFVASLDSLVACLDELADRQNLSLSDRASDGMFPTFITLTTKLFEGLNRHPFPYSNGIAIQLQSILVLAREAAILDAKVKGSYNMNFIVTNEAERLKTLATMLSSQCRSLRIALAVAGLIDNQ